MGTVKAWKGKTTVYRMVLCTTAVIICLFVGFTAGVKKEDFKTCNDASFCKRHREYAKGVRKVGEDIWKLGSSVNEKEKSAFEGYRVRDGSVELKDGEFRAVLEKIGAKAAEKENVKKEGEEEVVEDLGLKIVFLENDVVRVQVDGIKEKHKRYRGAGEYVLKGGEQGLVKSKNKLELKGKESDSGEKEDGKQYIVKYGENEGGVEKVVEIKANPWAIIVREGEERIVELNTKGFFKFEVTKEKKEGEEGWEEKFKTWTDSRSRGPESIGVDINFVGSQHVFGIPEHATSFSLKETGEQENGEYKEPYRLYNLDVFEHLEDSPMALYGSVPFMISHSSERTSGVFWMNSAETWIDIRKKKGSGAVSMFKKIVGMGGEARKEVNTHWISESGIMDVFVMTGPTPRKVFEQYAGMVGTTELPREFAIGYHQCRWNYLDQRDVAEVDQKMDENKIPYDVIWLDIEHTDGKRYFTWDYNKFPDPVAMQKGLEGRKRKLVTVVDPHIKRDSNYYISREGEEKGMFLKRRDGSVYNGWCWPGDSNWVDYFDPKAMTYISEQFGLEKYNGSTTNTFIWNDMNEPSVFNGPEITMDKDVVHYGGIEHRDIHNIYGMMYHKATYDGLKAREGGRQRPFVLSRAYFSGSQRYGAIWTGDNKAEWSHLEVSVAMVLTNNVVGMHFSGADVGGFFGNPDGELLARWYQLGVFYPFFRAHAHIDSKRREPYLFEDKYLEIIRKAVELRYSLLPYLYTQFFIASKTGFPITAPIWAHFPSASNFFDDNKMFMFGPALMVAPATTPGELSTIKLAFPDTQAYYDYLGDSHFSGHVLPSDIPAPLDQTLVYGVGGNIIASRQRKRRSSALMKNDPYTLTVFVSRTGSPSVGSLYIDDGNSYDYTKNQFIYTDFTFKNATIYASHSSNYYNSHSNSNSDSPQPFIDSQANVRYERIIVRGLRNTYFSTAMVYINDLFSHNTTVSCTKKRGGSCTIRDPQVFVSTTNWHAKLVF